jgi:hypothetical protein
MVGPMNATPPDLPENSADDLGTGAVRVVLSVDPDRFGGVVSAARAAGLTVTEELPAVSVVTGEIGRDLLGSLTDLDGVEAVEEERTFQLPPPESPLQ